MNRRFQPSEFHRFVAEIRRRRVFRFAFAYLASAFVVLQLAEIVMPAFGLGDDMLRVLVVSVALGFIPAVALAWIFDLTAEGIRRTESAEGVRRRVKLGALGALTVLCGGVAAIYLAASADPAAPEVADAQALAASERSGHAVRSIVVLPLEDLSPDTTNAYLAAGIHAELVAQLTRLESLRVVSRTTALHYAGTSLPAREIARELGVDIIVEGSIRRVGTEVRVTLHLTHAPTDTHVRTLQFDREVEDILDLQTAVAHAVVDELESSHPETLVPRGPWAASAPARESYLRGMYQYERDTPEGLARALDHFADALEREPEFAAALAALAGARYVESLRAEAEGEERGRELRQALEDARSATRLDSASAEAREVLALIEQSMEDRDATSPSDAPRTAPATRLGRNIAEGLRRQAVLQETDSVARDTAEAYHFMGTGLFARASPLLQEVVKRVPEDPRAWEMLVKSYVASGQVDEAAATVRRWHDSGSPRAPSLDAVRSLEGAVASEGSLGYWGWTLQRLESALDRGEDVAYTDLAAAHAALGHRNEALVHLVEAWRRREPGVFTLEVDPVWDNLRDDERFQVLVREIRDTRAPEGTGDSNADSSSVRTREAGAS